MTSQVATQFNIDREQVAYVKDFPKYLVTSTGDVISTCRKIIFKIKSHASNSGHLQVGLYDGGGTAHRKHIHHLVMHAFGTPAPSGKPCILHKNDDRKDNRIENLYWGDRHDNGRDRSLNNAEVQNRLNEQEVSLLKLLRQTFKTRFIAKIFRVTDRQIGNAVHGRTFKCAETINVHALSLPPEAEEIMQITQTNCLDDNGQERKYTEQEINFLQTIKGFVLKIK